MEKITLTIEDPNKLHFIKELLNNFDFIKIDSNKPVNENSLKDFVGIWSKSEADKMKANIREACEQIHDEEW